MKRSSNGEGTVEKQESIRLNRIRPSPNGVDLAIYSKKGSNRLNCLYIYPAYMHYVLEKMLQYRRTL